MREFTHEFAHRFAHRFTYEITHEKFGGKNYMSALPIDQILCGDAAELSRGKLPDCSVHAMVTDPPYGLEFMGEEWDKFKVKDYGISGFLGKPLSQHKRFGRKGEEGTQDLKIKKDFEILPHFFKGDLQIYQKWTTAWATEALRILKPGASMLVMGGTRTYHRMACGVEDAGFQIKDCLAWCYNSGFPKAQDLGIMFDKQECRRRLEQRLGRKPTKAEFKEAWKSFRKIVGRYTAPDGILRKAEEHTPHKEIGISSQKWGFETSGYRNLTAPATNLARKWDGWKVGGLKPAYEPILFAVKPPEGSYTDNVLKYGVGAINVDGCRIPFEDEDDIHGKNPHTIHKEEANYGIYHPYSNKQFDVNKQGRYPANMIRTDRFHDGYDRFYFVPKASKSERELGLEDFDAKQVMNFGHKENPGRNAPKKSYPHKNIHPTVKPVRLGEHLIRLVTRSGQIVADFFCGSGSFLVAARKLNRRYIGFDNKPDYAEIARHRLAAIPKPLEVYA